MSDNETQTVEPIRRFLYDKPEMAASIGVSEDLLDNLRKAGCPCVSIPGARRVLFDPVDVVEWLKGQNQREDLPSLSVANKRANLVFRQNL
jgi:hypothetical protein